MRQWLFYNFPVLDAAVFRRKADPDFEKPTFVARKAAGIGLVFNLLQSGLHGVVGLDFYDVDILLGLEQDVNPAIGSGLLYLDIFSHEFQDDVHGILEIFLRITLNLITGLGKERFQSLHEALGVAAADFPEHFGNQHHTGICPGRSIVS